MIPRRLAYRIWLACCVHQSGHLRSLTTPDALDTALDRGGYRGVAGAAGKADARLRRADRLDRAAGVLRAWIAGSGPRGGDLDHAVVSLVAAHLHDHTAATAELRARAAARGRHDGPDPADLAGFVRWVLEID